MFFLFLKMYNYLFWHTAWYFSVGSNEEREVDLKKSVHHPKNTLLVMAIYATGYRNQLIIFAKYF